MNEIKTHQMIKKELSGTPIEIGKDFSKLELITNSQMVLDDSRLIHGGFVFSLADYAAMLAINHPNVVLGGANVKFLKPIVEGDHLIAEAHLTKIESKKYIVEVEVYRDNDLVFNGEFICFIPKKHVLMGV